MARNPSPQALRGLRKDMQEAIDRVWPDGVVDPPFELDESYFWEVHPKLSRALSRIKNAHLVHEREADPEPIWGDESDPEDAPPDEIGQSRSYHTFFVSPEGEAFTFETEADDITEPEFITEEFEEAGWDQDPPISSGPGSGRTGWVVAVSLLAPFAVIELNDMVTFEDGSATEIEIESYLGTADGGWISAEERFRKVGGAQAYKMLVTLRAKVAGILEKSGITVLPAEEWRKPAPWLQPGGDTLVGGNGKTIRVLDAFFFASL